VRTSELIGAYFQVAARCGSAFAADGIGLSDGFFLQPDRAAMNAAMKHCLIKLDDVRGIFMATAHGWNKIREM